MSSLDADTSIGLTPVEADREMRFSPALGPEAAPCDLLTLYERERTHADREQARADAAEARCEELCRAEGAARSQAGLWKSRFDRCRSKRTAIEEETKELRRAVKAGAPGLHREVERLREELSRALAEPSAAASRARENRAGALAAENRELRKALERAENHKATIRTLNAEIVRLNSELRRRQSEKTTLRMVSEKATRKLKSRLAALQAVGATLSRLPFDEAAQLRTVLRRSRHQKNTIDRQRRENARLRRTEKGLRNRIARQEADVARLRATGKVLSKKLYGRKSEQQQKPRSDRKRGQQRGAPGHGRTKRPGLEERPEVHAPPPEACVCGQCGQPYAPNGVEESTLVEIEVKAHKRVIQRERFRRPARPRCCVRS